MTSMFSYVDIQITKCFLFSIKILNVIRNEYFNLYRSFRAMSIFVKMNIGVYKIVQVHVHIQMQYLIVINDLSFPLFL